MTAFADSILFLPAFASLSMLAASLGLYHINRRMRTTERLRKTKVTVEEDVQTTESLSEQDLPAIWKVIGFLGVLLPGHLYSDTLRLEMGYALYGNDITKETHPLEARLGWITKFDKGEFTGKEALLKIKEEGLKRRLVGFEVEEKRSIPRHGYDIVDADGNKIGVVSSGTMSITLEKAIGMGYVDLDHAEEGSEIYIAIRKKQAKAVVSKPPFIKK